MATFDPLRDSVWSGRIPDAAQQRIKDALSKHIEDMDDVEIAAFVKKCEVIVAETHEAEVGDLLSQAGIRFRDEYHQKIYVAESAGDKYLAEEIIQRDYADSTTTNHAQFPTKTESALQKRANLYAILADIPHDLKETIIRNEISPLVADEGPKARLNIPGTLPASSKALEYKDRTPIIYCQYMMDRHGNHPTAQQLEAMLVQAEDYLSDITYSTSPPSRPARPTLPLIQPIIDIESAASRAHGTSSTRDMTVTKWRNALGSNKSLPCKYVSKRGDIEYIRKIITRIRKWLSDLAQAGHDPNEPLVWVPASAGYTNDGPRRRHEYQSHNSVSLHITFFDAVARSMKLGFGMRWRAIYKPHSEETIRMAEHVFSCLNGTYLCMNGLNVAAAGLSNTSGSRTWVAAYAANMKATVARLSFRTNIKELVKQISTDHKNLLRVQATQQVLVRLKKIKADQDALADKERDAEEQQRDAEIKMKQAMGKFIPILRRHVAGAREMQQACARMEELEVKLARIMNEVR